jgi:DNA-binding protein H-NS
MTSYRELLSRRAELEREIVAARSIEADRLLERIKAMLLEHGLTPEDLGWTRTTRRKIKTVGPKRYRNPDTGETWNGYGRPPKWLKPGDRLRYLDPDDAAADVNDSTASRSE